MLTVLLTVSLLQRCVRELEQLLSVSATLDVTATPESHHSSFRALVGSVLVLGLGLTLVLAKKKRCNSGCRGCFCPRIWLTIATSLMLEMSNDFTQTLHLAFFSYLKSLADYVYIWDCQASTRKTTMNAAKIIRKDNQFTFQITILDKLNI